MQPKDRPPEAERFIDRETNELIRLLRKDEDLVPETLRFHLIVESQLDRIISALLPRGKLLCDDRRFGFYRKLQLVEALMHEAPDAFVCLERLNTVRNNCAHDREKVVTVEDLDKIGLPLGGQYAQLRTEHVAKVHDLAMALFATVFGILSVYVYRSENPAKP